MKNNPRLRQEIAVLAAKIICDEGVNDYGMAKQKAAGRLGNTSKKNLPANEEIEQAVFDHQNLFGNDSQHQYIQTLRQTAHDFMQLLQPFATCLTGAVLNGSASMNSLVELHAFTDNAESVGFKLDDYGIPYELKDKRLRLSKTDFVNLPCYRFLANETPVSVTVLAERYRQHPPLSPINGKPMQYCNLAELEILLQE